VTLGAAPPSPLARLAAWARLGAIAHLEQTYSVPGAFAAGSFLLLIGNIPTDDDPQVTVDLVDGQGNVLYTAGPMPTLASTPVQFPASLGIISANGYQLNLYWTYKGTRYVGAQLPVTGAFLYPVKQSTIAVDFPALVTGFYLQVQAQNADGTDYTGGGDAFVLITQGGIPIASGYSALDPSGLADAAFPTATAGTGTLEIEITVTKAGKALNDPPKQFRLNATQLLTSPGPGLVVPLTRTAPPPHGGRG